MNYSNCGAEWQYTTGRDIREEWHETSCGLVCEQCHKDMIEATYEKWAESVRLDDSGNQPS